MHHSLEVRDFLLRTGILPHLNEAFCDALLPGGRSRDILHEPEATNLFLTPVEGEKRSYRYQSWFAGFLRTQLCARCWIL
jgi:LuxR family maltose regulon positive regulatory protein